MSGLETAIRNALAKSDRTSPEIRARIYQSARQALDSGLAKQGVTDAQMVATQRQRLELKIREIEGEERSRVQAPGVATPAPTSPVPVSPAARDPVASLTQRPASPPPEAEDASFLGGAMRDDARSDAPGSRAADASSLDSLRPERDDAPTAESFPDTAADTKPGRRHRFGRDGTTLDVPPKRAAKPRRRRGFLSVLAAWLVFFGLIGAAGWWAYSSGLVQQSLDQAIEAANQASRNQSSGQQGLGPQVGFSADWLNVFDGTNTAVVQASAPATMEPVTTASGAAVRLASGAVDATGDIAVEIPADVLGQLAGKTSTLALTVQSGAESGVQFSVRCEFASLGACSRHRFSAQQEKADALFRVTFDASAAPGTSGRLLINTSVAGESNPVLLYAVRILPGQ
ncbi:MAG: hypothetical protein ACK4P4_18025 [Allorhizobium sp.]